MAEASGGAPLRKRRIEGILLSPLSFMRKQEFRVSRLSKHSVIKEHYSPLRLYLISPING